MTLQEKLINELLDPRSSLSPRENAAAEEIRWLRSQIPGVNESWKLPEQKAEQGAKGKREATDK
jgi:hypothetical protein